MIPHEVKKKIYAWMPKELNGVAYPVFESGQYVPRPDQPNETGKRLPTIPGISLGYLSGGRRTKFFADPLKVSRADNGDEEVTYGQYHALTLTVVCSSYDPRERDRMGAALEKYIFKHCHDLNIQDDKVRFVDVIMPRLSSSNKARKEEKKVYRGILDLEFEYEVSWQSEEPVIMTFNNDIHVIGAGEDIITIIRSVRDCGFYMTAPVQTSKAASFGMGALLVRNE